MSEVQVRGKFNLHNVGMSAATFYALTQEREWDEVQPEIAKLVDRHVTGDWGDVDAHDARENEKALKSGRRILSAYTLFGIKLWIITDAAWYDDPLDREVTTILRPEDY